MERITVQLEDNEFMSDKIVLPKDPGFYCIDAPTGAGKTYFMTRAAGKNGLVLFPVKSVMQQQQIKARKDGIKTNIIQIERLKQQDIDSATSIHFDEAQLIYEGGFRYDSKKSRTDVGTLMEMLEEAAKRIPIYLYSATAKEQLYHFEIKQFIDVKKKFERVLNVVHIDKATGTKSKTSIQTFVDIIRQMHSVNPAKIVVFLDSAKTLAAIQQELLKETIESDGDVLEVKKITSEIISSDSSKSRKKYPAFHSILENETISQIDVDVVLCTSTLEAGININDDVTIISEQVDEGKLFQRFGRARNQGTFILIAGNGSEVLDIIPSTVIDDEFAALLKDKCQFRNKAHAASCDTYKLYSTRASMMKHAWPIIGHLNDKGYSPDFELVVQYGRTPVIQGSKKQLIDFMENEQLDISKVSVELLADAMKCTETHAAHHIEKYTNFKTVIEASPLIRAPIDYVYTMLSDAAITLVSALVNPKFKERREKLERMMAEIKQWIPAETDKASLDSASDVFFEEVFPDIDPSCYRKLFRVLMGYVSENGRLVLKTDEQVNDWWKSKNMKQTEINKYNRRKAKVEEIGPMYDFHQETKLTQIEVVELPLKEFKNKCSRFSEEQLATINSIKF